MRLPVEDKSTISQLMDFVYPIKWLMILTKDAVVHLESLQCFEAIKYTSLDWDIHSVYVI